MKRLYLAIMIISILSSCCKQEDEDNFCLPDLAIDYAVVLGGSELFINDNFSVEYTIANHSKCGTSIETHIEFTVYYKENKTYDWLLLSFEQNDNSISKILRPIPIIRAGETYQFLQTFRFSRVGIYKIEVKVDSLNEIMERNENNNN